MPGEPVDTLRLQTAPPSSQRFLCLSRACLGKLMSFAKRLAQNRLVSHQVKHHADLARFDRGAGPPEVKAAFECAIRAEQQPEFAGRLSCVAPFDSDQRGGATVDHRVRWLGCGDPACECVGSNPKGPIVLLSQLRKVICARYHDT